MASSSSSSQNIPSHLLLNPYGGPLAAPPPTPSTQPTTDTTAAADTLARLLHRLPPTLSFPARLSPRATTNKTSLSLLPTISLSSPGLTASFFELGYFQLSPHDHSISPQLAKSAESEAFCLFDLPTEQRRDFFPKDNWPLGYDDDVDGDHIASFCLENGRLPHAITSESSFKLTSLGELTRELEKVGLNVVDKLASTMGFENPFGENGSGMHSSLMWVSLSEVEKTGRVYPYVVGLQYQIRAKKWSLCSDAGSVHVEPKVGSILVTFGDIAQVWSNGKLKKVRGRPMAEDEVKSSSHDISMTMLLTLPLESTVTPFLLSSTNIMETEVSLLEKDDKESDNDSNDDDDNENASVFDSFSFEDYAWRVYHEHLHLKDPLDRYRRSECASNTLMRWV